MSFVFRISCVALAAFSLLTMAGCGDDNAAAWHERAVLTAAVSDQDARLVAQFGERVYFAGQPTEAGLRGYLEKGVQTVINLRTQDEMDRLDFDEAQILASSGVRYVHAPIGGTEPSEAELEKLFAELEKAAEGPILFHCASSNRCGYAWSLYRAKKHGLALEAAIDEGKTAGMRAPKLEQWARNAIGSGH